MSRPLNDADLDALIEEHRKKAADFRQAKSPWWADFHDDTADALTQLRYELGKKIKEVDEWKILASADRKAAVRSFARAEALEEQIAGTSNELDPVEEMKFEGFDPTSAPRCPVCRTFGHDHRKDCRYRADGMKNHIHMKKP